MALTENTSLYEILIRVDQAGGWAAHYQDITTISRDGVIVSANVGPAVPVPKDGGAAYEVLKSLIGEAAIGSLGVASEALAQLELTKEQLADALMQIDAYKEKLGQQNGGA